MPRLAAAAAQVEITLDDDRWAYIYVNKFSGTIYHRYARASCGTARQRLGLHSSTKSIQQARDLGNQNLSAAKPLSL